MESLIIMRKRLCHALRPAAWHFLLSVCITVLVGLVVFGLWFSVPLGKLSGGTELFWLIIGIDVVCGPLLTLIVFSITKPRAELLRDLTVVGIIQLLALGYGVHTLSHARPVALVHEVDRFRVISFADLDEAEAAQIPAWAHAWSFSRPRTVGVRAPQSGEERLSSISASLQGVEPSQRPSWWQDYALSVPQVLQRARPLTDLRSKHPEQSALIDAAVARAIADAQAGETIDIAALRWLPLVSRRATDWVVLLDPVTGRVRGYVHLDGF